MAASTRRHLSPVLALALLASLLAVSSDTHAQSASSYDNAERLDVSSFTDAGIEVSRRVFPDGAGAAVLTRDDHFPDALAASALAARVNGPVLFTDPGMLTSATAAELDRILGPGDTVYVAGGPVAVSDAVVDELRDRGYQVTRLAGETRVETAVEVAEVVGLPDSGHVLIARAFGPAGKDRTVGWVDSVTCGAYANHTTTPVLLTQPDALDAATAAALDDLGATAATICGGPAAVSEQVASQLRDAGLTVTRAAGETRVETAVAVAEQLFGHASAEGHTYLLVNGYGENFGWGLAATPLAGALGAPILLVGTDQPTSCADTSQQARGTLCHLETVGDGVAVLVVVGSSAQINDQVMASSAQSAGGRPDSTPAGPPGAPTGVHTTNVSTQAEGRVHLRWNAVDHDDLAGYNVWYGTGEPNTRAGSDTPTVAAGTTEFTVGALQLDTTYEFAVTAVGNDGQESAKSAVASERTSPASVNIVDPTTPGTDPGQAVVESNGTVPITFTYELSQGGSYQLMYKREVDTAWTPFSEVGSGKPLQPGSNEKTVDVVAPANTSDENVSYWLRAAVYPAGGSTAEISDDVEVDALLVLGDIDEAVTVDAPTKETGRARAFPGAPFGMAFTYSTKQATTYQVSYRETATGDDFTPFDDPDATGDVTQHSPGEQVTVELDAPDAVARYDLLVELLDDGGTATAQSVADDALVVRNAEVGIVEPTGSAPAVRAADGTLDVTFEYVSDAEREYTVSYRGEDGTWQPFSGGTGTVATATTPTDETVTLFELPEGGTYDLRVGLRDSGDTEDDASDMESGALVVASIDLTDPAADDPMTVGSGQTFPFTFNVNADGEYRLVGIDDEGTDGDIVTWTAVQAAPDGVTKQATAPTNGTEQDETYDLILEFRLDGSTDADAFDQESAALIVEGQSATSPQVQITDPTPSSPAETVGGGTYDVEFTTTNVPDGSTYTITVGSTSVSGDVDASGTTTHEGVPAPAHSATYAENTHDVVVEVLDSGGTPLDDDTAVQAWRVASVEITQVPTATESQPFTLDFKSNVSGIYKVFHSDDGGNSWTAFSDGTDDSWTIGETPAPDDTQSRTLQAPGAESYDIRLALNLDETSTPTEDASDASDDDTLTVNASTGPTITIISPAQGAANTEEPYLPGGLFDITFSASHAGTYRLSWRPSGSSQDPIVFAGLGVGAADGGGQQQSAPVSAPLPEDVYDIWAHLETDTNEAPAFDDDEDVNTEAIEVAVDVGGVPDLGDAGVQAFLAGRTCVSSQGLDGPKSYDGFSLAIVNGGSEALTDVHVAFTLSIEVGGAGGFTDGWDLAYREPGETGYTPIGLIRSADGATLTGNLPPAGAITVQAQDLVQYELELTVANFLPMVVAMEAQVEDADDQSRGEAGRHVFAVQSICQST